MKVFVYNIKYFIREAADVFWVNKGSNFLSFISSVLIFFVLTLMIGGWMVTTRITQDLMGEGEVSAYLVRGISSEEKKVGIEEIRDIKGVVSVVEISKDQAYEQMEKVLGEDAKVLSYFDDNPFEAFLEVNIELDERDHILLELEKVKSVESIRDNKEVLDKLSQISDLLNLLSLVILVAVGVTTVVIVSHIVRQSVYYHKEQINTLQLLGAPNSFVVTPFYIEGLALTIISSGVAILLSSYVFDQLFKTLIGPLPFIPLPSYSDIMIQLSLIMIGLGIGLGIMGCFTGIKSASFSER